MSWNDEFDGNTLNDTLWDIEVHPPGWVNDELEGYTEEDVLIEVLSLPHLKLRITVYHDTYMA